jgi:hypothetical protein
MKYEVAPVSIVRFLSALMKPTGGLYVSRLALVRSHCGREPKKSKKEIKKKI